MRDCDAAACLGAACIAAVTSGACASLVAVPPPLVLVTGAALIVVAVRGAGHRPRFAAAHAALGAMFVLALPRTIATPPGGVITRGTAATSTVDLFDVLDRLDRDADALLGNVVAVTGEWTPASRGHLATVSRRIMTCCAADAVRIGFDVAPDHIVPLPSGAWVRVRGIVQRRLDDGEMRYVLEQSRVSGLEESRDAHLTP